MIRILPLIMVSLAPVLAAQGWNLESTSWSGRVCTTATEFNNRLWVVGGVGSYGNDDVWSTADGITWDLETDNAGWPSRYLHTTVVFNGKLWVIAGAEDMGPTKSDIWSSPDGVNWTLETSSAPFGARYGHTSLVFNNRIWVIAGGNDTSILRDVWSSADGATWTQHATPQWDKRWLHTSAVFNGRMWVVAGQKNTLNAYNDVWYSTDGDNWTLAVSGGKSRQAHAMVVHNNQLVVACGQPGGFSSSPYTDVLASSDGVNWTVKTNSAPAKSSHSLASFHGKLWLLGGSDYQDAWQAEIWSSSDGASWVLETGDDQWFRRHGHTTVTLDGRIWVMGGWWWRGNHPQAGPDEFRDVWSSSNGRSWQRHTESAGWGKRAHHASVAFNGRLWVMGGEALGVTYNDVWSSADGVTWVNHSTAPWSKRSGHAAVVFNNRMWVIGGTDGGNEVWSSPDGLAWTLETASPGFSARFWHGAAVLNGRIWVAGGTAGGTDVWSSADGVNWTLATSSPGWGARYGLTLQAYNNKLWALGGFQAGAGYLDEVWSSADGVSWTQQPSAPWVGRRWHTSAVFDARLWVLGGSDGETRSDVWSYTEPTPSLEVRESGSQLAHNQPSAGTSREFAPLAVGAGPSAYVTITLHNAGSGDLQLSGATLAGDAADFDLDASSLPATLPPGDFTSIAIAFTPQMAGSKLAWIELAHNDTAQPQPWRIEVSGVGVPPAAPVLQVREGGPGGAQIINGAQAAGSRDFGYLEVGTQSPVLTVYVFNAGTADLTLGAPAITGNFTINPAQLPLTLAPGNGGSLEVTVLTTASGPAAGTISFTHNDSSTTTPFTCEVKAYIYTPGNNVSEGARSSTEPAGCTSSSTGLALPVAVLLLALLTGRRRRCPETDVA